MSDETEINAKINNLSNNLRVWKDHPTIVQTMQRNLDYELEKLANLKSKPIVNQEVLDSLRETFKNVTKSTTEYWDEIAREHRIEQERMINNDLTPVMMENKVTKTLEYNSKCWLCGTPCNRDGKISMCASGCK